MWYVALKKFLIYCILFTEWITQFTLARETGWVTWISVPFVFTIVHVPITVSIEHPISSIVWVKVEVILPSSCHAIIIMVLEVYLRTVIPFVPISIVRYRIGVVLHLLKVSVVSKVLIELGTIRSVRVDMTVRE